MASPTRGATQVLIRGLGTILDRLVDGDGRKPHLTIKGIAPDGRLIGHEVTVEPLPKDAIAVRAQLLEILTTFEQEWGVWTSCLELRWSVATTPELWVGDGSFREAY